MASGFFIILDDIVALMDDVASASKIATQKTAGILGDDLAVNAEKATGFLASRELPTLWKITKGSFINKIIIIPAALLLQYFLPKAIIAILLLGAFFLAYEGVEKVIEWLFHRSKKGQEIINEPTENTDEIENNKIKSAIITDFILSIEIVIIALSTVLEQSLKIQILTVAVVSTLATVGVYGIVALIVRMDDFGYAIVKNSKNNQFLKLIGQLFINALPWVIKILGMLGTLALLLVAGGIIEHQITSIHHYFANIHPELTKLILGLFAGILTIIIVTPVKKIVKLFIKTQA